MLPDVAKNKVEQVWRIDEVQLSYAIGVARPISIMVDTFNTARVPEAKIVELVEKHFDLRPAEIIKEFDLKRPLYLQVAKHGHFGG